MASAASATTNAGDQSQASPSNSKTVWEVAAGTGTAYVIMGVMQVVLSLVVLGFSDSMPNGKSVPRDFLLFGMVIGAIWAFAGLLLFMRSTPAIWTGLCVGGLINVLYVAVQGFSAFAASPGQRIMPLFWAWVGFLILKSAGTLWNVLTNSRQ